MGNKKMVDKNPPKNFFTPIKITDPVTGKERIIEAEEQEEMLEKGILFAPIKEKKETKKNV